MTSRDTVLDRGYGREHAGRLWRGYGPLASLIVLLALPGARPLAMASGAIDIAVTVGFADTFRPGHWTPLSVTLTNRGADLAGALEVQVSGDGVLRGRPRVSTHRRRLELDRAARKRLQFVVQPQGLSRPLVIRVRSGGEELARTEVDLRSRFSAQRLLLVLGRDADLDYLNDGAVDGLRVLYPHPELLPAHWRGYDAVAAIVLQGLSLDRLSEKQFDALHKWLAQGGTLAVSGGVDYALLRSARLAALLPGVPQGITRLDAGALKDALGASLEVTSPVPVNRLGAFRGQVRLRAGEIPLIVEHRVGRGRVLYLTFDVASPPFDRWQGMRALFLQTLQLPPAAMASLGATEPGPVPPLMELIRDAAPTYPTSATAFLFLVLYLGLLLAACALAARAPRQNWLAAAGGWAAPALFASAAWLLFGPGAFPRGASAAAVAVIEPLPHSGYARLTLELGMYSSRSRALRLEYLGVEPVFAPHRQAQRDGKIADWVFGDGPRPYAEALDQRRYVLHALEGEDVIAFRLDASIVDEAKGPRLDLNNASGRGLEAVWLVFAGYAYEVGPVAAGARVERRLIAATHGVATGSASWRDVLRTSSGASPHLPAAALSMVQRRLQETSGSESLAPGDALLVARTSNPMRLAGASAHWSQQESTAVALRIAVVAGDSAANEADSARADMSRPGGPESDATPHATVDRAATGSH